MYSTFISNSLDRLQITTPYSHILRIFIFSLCLLASNSSWSQADCGGGFSPRPINDDITEYLILEVLNAQINDLGNPLQCVKLIELEFKHDLVADITLTLISPSGQRVQLIGPITSEGQTQLTRWDIDFFQCDDAVIPDSGFGQQWSNEQPWAILTTYEGGYWPYQGCLEDFDTGPVNGFWTLEITDGAEFQEGIIEHFKIVFCNTNNDLCTRQCNADAGSADTDELTFCEMDPALRLNLNFEYDGDPPDPNLFGLSYILQENGDILSVTDEADYRELPPGEYELYTFSYDIDKKTELLADLEINGLQSILDALEPGSITACVDISDEPIQLVVEEIGSLVEVYEESCDGEPLEYQGNTYENSGIYLIQPSNGSCDVVTQLEVVIFNFVPEIIDAGTELTCDNRELTLTAFPTSDNYTYDWNTDDGSIIDEDEEAGTIRIDQPGTYSLRIKGGDCESTDTEIVITQDEDFPTVDIEVEQRDCTVDVYRLGAVLPETFSSFEWMGPDDSIFTDQVLEVDGVGEYTLIVRNERGCSNETSVELNRLRDFIYNAIQPACDEDNLGRIVFNTVIGGIPPISYSIDGGMTFFEEEPFFDDLPPGSYNLMIRDINLCTIDTSAVILTSAADFTVELDATNQAVTGQPRVITPIIIDNSDPPKDFSYEWIWEGETIGTDEELEFEFDQDGTLAFIVTTEDGCPLETRTDIELIGSQEPQIYIPNVFNPDEGNMNAEFQVFPGPNIDEISYFKIYDRWGNLVYTTDIVNPRTDPPVIWDGTLNGSQLKSGVYVYVTNVRLITTQEYNIKGTITLLR